MRKYIVASASLVLSSLALTLPAAAPGDVTQSAPPNFPTASQIVTLS